MKRRESTSIVLSRHTTSGKIEGLETARDHILKQACYQFQCGKDTEAQLLRKIAQELTPLIMELDKERQSKSELVDEAWNKIESEYLDK